MKTLVSITLSILAFSATAQHHPTAPSAYRSAPVAPWTQQILNQQADAELAALRTTAQQQRITGISYKEGASTDSTAYLWKTRNRTALHNPKNINTYLDNYYPYASVEADSLSSRNQYIFADSVLYYSAGAKSGTQGYAYNAANKPVRITDYRANGQAASSITLVYNTAGLNTRCTTENFQSQTVEQQQFSGYDAAGRLVTDTVVSDNTNGKDTTWYYRSYNAAGRLEQILSYGPSSDSIQHRFTYNSAGLLVLTTRAVNVPGMGWTINQKDSLAYNGTNPAYTAYYTFYNLAPQGLAPVSRELNTLNAGGFWSSRLYQLYDFGTNTWKDYSRMDLTYNSVNNYQMAKVYTAQQGSPLPAAPSGTYSFYYETFTPASVDAVTGQDGTIQVVPNPAAGAFHIRRAAAGAAHYSLTDVTGRVVAQGQLQLPAETVGTADLARGLYLLTVQAAGAAPQTTRVVLN